jgi:hypothetical protein
MLGKRLVREARFPDIDFRHGQEKNRRKKGERGPEEVRLEEEDGRAPDEEETRREGRSQAEERRRQEARGQAPRRKGRKGRKESGLGRRVRDLDLDTLQPLEERGLGPEAGGQAGDTEGLSQAELAASESVEELVEEGQAFEAGIVDGVESAPDADQGPIRTREVPEDDVPEEYIDQDRERS